MITAVKSNNRMAKKDAKDKGAAAERAAGKGSKKGRMEELLVDNPALRNTLAQIDKEFGEGTIMPLGADSQLKVEGISTGSLSVDIALGGFGLPRGRVVEIFGPESSGKTTLALHVIASAQRGNGIAAFIDAEHALDPSWAKKLGVELQRRRSDEHLRNAREK
jgi:recombination protein RecA